MKVLCTGCAGFIGSWICEALLNDGHYVIGVDDLSTGSEKNIAHLWPKKNEQFQFYIGDLRDPSYVKYLFDYHSDIGIIYHLAANAREGASFYQPQSVVSRNTGAYINVLTEGIKHDIKKMILFSSIAVYGDNDVPYLETMIPNPVDIYGLQKWNMERITEMLAKVHGFNYVIFRPHNVFGPRQALNDIHRNVFGIWMNQIMRGESITIYGDGSQQRAFSYIEDSLPAYLKAIELEKNWIINIGSDEPVSINDAVNMVLGAMGEVPNYPTDFLDQRHKEVWHAHSSHSKAFRLLGLKQNEEIDYLKECIQKMANWAKGQGPQDWKTIDPIELPNERMPEIWK